VAGDKNPNKELGGGEKNVGPETLGGNLTPGAGSFDWGGGRKRGVSGEEQKKLQEGYSHGVSRERKKGTNNKRGGRKKNPP